MAFKMVSRFSIHLAIAIVLFQTCQLVKCDYDEENEVVEPKVLTEEILMRVERNKNAHVLEVPNDLHLLADSLAILVHDRLKNPVTSNVLNHIYEETSAILKDKIGSKTVKEMTEQLEVTLKNQVAHQTIMKIADTVKIVLKSKNGVRTFGAMVVGCVNMVKTGAAFTLKNFLVKFGKIFESEHNRDTAKEFIKGVYNVCVPAKLPK